MRGLALVLSLTLAVPGYGQNQTPEMRIVVLGTSLTAGYDWPDRLQDELRKCLGRQVGVLRVARPGAGSDWALGALKDVTASAPDIVIVELAINDADLFDGIPVRQSRRNHERIIRELTDALPDAGIVLMTTNPVYGLRRFQRPRLDRFYDIYRDLADGGAAHLADTHASWRTRDDARESFDDGVHPANDAATKIILPVLLSALVQDPRIPADCSPPPAGTAD